ncbi:Hypothetical predicted protein [Lecanosticta acicola]|uniref:GDS1 winged helix domain-containing protein n=1 Tax=Lecanosticta acicola TaxID=111012 RepID=A0AAI8YSL0_9PEZI|nr:Hypothetical predicted protein [Lecanosticta acicola]
MQTRRKSLNLADLGVVAPKRAHPSPPATVIEGDEQPSAKRAKRSHANSQSPPPGLMSPPQTTTIRVKDARPKPATTLSPPPSPVAEGSSSSKIDTEGISDDIVVATIQQIEKTGNRPHLVKELAAILATKLHAIEKSANPCALISSRLTAYLQRPWPAISPCPLAKDIAPVHPRRLYFYLTTTPRQPIPEVTEPLPKANRIISPSLSSAADEEDRYLRQRQALSPSPEVDLSSPELEEDHGDAPPTPGGSYSARNSMPRDRSSSYTHPRRAASPPLENEERDFKQTANALYEQAKARRNSQESQQDVNMEHDALSGADQDARSVTMSIEAEETEESLALKNSEAAAALFGASKMLAAQHMELSSPVLEPQNGLRVDTTRGAEADHPDRLDKDEGQYNLPEAAFAWEHLQSPEDIELEELDDMLDAY